jgi:hypothetical protein
MTFRLPMRSLFLGTVFMCAAALLGTAAAKDRKDCESDYKPQVGQSGKDVVWVPTPDELVRRMLQMAKVSSQDVVYDLGAGDGKIAIAAGKLGAQSVGIEYNPDMAKLASCMVDAEGVGNKTRIIQGDIFKEDFGKATVVTMYLLPELNLCVRHRLLGMKPGTRVASHQFTMGDWDADETSEIEYRTAYLWIVPARVDGTWQLRDAGGTATTINLTQNFQKISGEVVGGASKQPLVGASLRGDQLKFAFNDDKGTTRTFTGTVRGTELVGNLKSGTAETKATGTLQGPLRAAAWAEMLPQCGRFYGK